MTIRYVRQNENTWSIEYQSEMQDLLPNGAFPHQVMPHFTILDDDKIQQQFCFEAGTEWRAAEEKIFSAYHDEIQQKVRFDLRTNHLREHLESKGLEYLQAYEVMEANLFLEANQLMQIGVPAEEITASTIPVLSRVHAEKLSATFPEQEEDERFERRQMEAGIELMEREGIAGIEEKYANDAAMIANGFHSHEDLDAALAADIEEEIATITAGVDAGEEDWRRSQAEGFDRVEINPQGDNLWSIGAEREMYPLMPKHSDGHPRYHATQFSILEDGTVEQFLGYDPETEQECHEAEKAIFSMYRDRLQATVLPIAQNAKGYVAAEGISFQDALKKAVADSNAHIAPSADQIEEQQELSATDRLRASTAAARAENAMKAQQEGLSR